MHASRTVLIIDDDPNIREALQLVLGNKGYRVISAPDGDAGIRRALKDQPDLVIVDMMMPRTSGFTVLEQLKHHHRLNVPIIMLTGNDSDHQREYAEILGVDRYLNKPVHPADLLQSVDHFCPLPSPTVTPIP